MGSASCSYTSSLKVLALIIFVGAVGVGIKMGLPYMGERRILKLYKNATCLITNQTFDTYDKTECMGSMSGAACATAKHTYNELFVSYIIWNGTLVNSTTSISTSGEKHYARGIGTHHECFYNPELVTDVRFYVSDGTDDLIIVCVCFGIGFAMLPLILIFCVNPWIIKKEEEKRNRSNQNTSIQMKMLTSNNKSANPNEKVYVADIEQ